MKRTISILVVLVMLASMCTFMMTGVSANILKATYEDAKDGDLLYEVKFGETSGVYVPTQFNALQEGDTGEGAVTITDNGRTLAYYKPSLQSKTSFYGGQIEGLTWGEGKAYTITMKLALPKNRGGVYFNFPSEAKKAELTGDAPNNSTYNTVLYGFYGRFTPEGDMGSMIGGGKVEGRYRFDPPTGGSYKEFDQILVEEGTFLDVKFLIEDYTYAIFVEDMFLDVIDLSEEAVKGVCDNIGFSVYLYHIAENKPMIVKDVNVYKGVSVALEDAQFPKYAKTYKHYKEDPINTTVPDTTVPDTTVADTTVADTTVADTTTAANTTKPAAVTTAATKKEGGCGGAVAGGFAVIALVSLAGVTVAKKRIK